VYAYALRGHAHSDAPEGAYDQATLVEDLKQLLDALKVKRTSLLEWSMGDVEMTHFARLYPARVEKLVLASLSAAALRPLSRARHQRRPLADIGVLPERGKAVVRRLVLSRRASSGRIVAPDAES
jgi:pimeloyl-ACP methyl ester carboxylesterase